MSHTNNLNRIKTVMFFIVIGVLFYILNIYSTFINDDCIYSFIKGDDTPITSLSDAIHSQIYDYFHANGRFIIHTIVQYFCGVLGFPFFKVCNSAMFVVLCMTSYFILKNEFKHSVNKNTTLLFILLIMIFGVCRIYLDNISCSVNYLWTSSCILLFILLWEKELNAKQRGMLQYSILFLISGVIGSLQESFSFGLAGALFIYCILNHKELKKGSFVLAAGFIIGTTVNVFAPSNFIRLESTGGPGNSFHIFLSRTFSCFYNSDSLLVLLVLLTIFYINDRKGCLAFLTKNLILILSIVFNVLFVIIIAYTASHQLTCIELFSIILIIKLIYTRYPDFIKNHKKPIQLSLISILLIIYVPVLYSRKDIGTGHEILLRNARQSTDGYVVAKEYYHSCLTKDNWFYKNFTRREIYNDFCNVGLSAIVTNGKDWKYIKSIIPDTKENIANICNKENTIGKFLYKDAYSPYYIIKTPINGEIVFEDLNIEVAYEPAARDWLKNLINHTGLVYNTINKQTIDSFDYEGFKYHIIYDSVEHRVMDIKVSNK